MKKHLLFFAIFSFSMLFSQDTENTTLNHQKFFVSFDGQVGFDFAELIREKKPFYENDPQTHHRIFFSYAITAMAGYQLTKHLSLAGGFRYAYVTPNLHPVYFIVQPRYYFNIDDEKPLYFGAYYGQKINHTTSEQAGTFGITLGQQNPISNHANLNVSLFLETQGFGQESAWFVGLSLGISLFTGKNAY